MDPFLADAESILKTAMGVLASGYQPTEMVILSGGRGGQIQLIAECDWPLDSIRVERGAVAAYRVSSFRNTVVVEGNQQGRRCRLEQSVPATRVLPLVSRTPPVWMTKVRQLTAA